MWRKDLFLQEQRPVKMEVMVKQLNNRFIFYLLCLMLLVVGCSKDSVPTAGTEKARLTVEVGPAQPLETGTLSKSVAIIPDGITSVNLKITRGNGDLYSECKDVTPGTTVSFSSIQVEAGQNTSFNGEAFPQASCTGDLIFRGSTIGVTLVAGDNPIVQVNLSLIDATPPVVTTDAATNVESTCTDLNGKINSNGFETVSWFEWGLDSNYGSQTATKQMGSGTLDSPLTEKICGLDPSTEYHYRAVASNGGNMVFGVNQAFRTLPNPDESTSPVVPISFAGLPTMTTDPATNVTSRSATLNGSVNPEGADTQVYIEWGESLSYGNRTPLHAFGNVFDALSFVGTISGLTPETEYHFRAVGFNAFGTTLGADQLLRTLSSEVFGIFSESASPGLNIDTDSFIGVFSGGNATFDDFSEDTVEVQEGTLSLKSTLSVTPPTGFAGWFVSWGTSSQTVDNSHVRDMSFFSGGSLTLAVKTPIDLEVGIRSGNVSAGTESSKILLSQIDSSVADSTWRQVCIPLSIFEGAPPKAELSRIKVFFVISSAAPTGGTAGVTESFWVDDVRWEKEPCS